MSHIRYAAACSSIIVQGLQGDYVTHDSDVDICVLSLGGLGIKASGFGVGAKENSNTES